MYTLEQIYTRLSGGGNATKMTAFTEPSSGPGTGTMHTLDELYALAWPARVPKTGQTRILRDWRRRRPGERRRLAEPALY